MEEILYLIGQILGVIAILLGFLTYQVRSQRALLIIHIITTVVFSTHYGLIGAYTGMAMNALGLVRNLFYYHRNQKGKSERITPIVFTVLMGIVGAVTWEAWYSVFMLLGLMINTYAMSFARPQNVRKSILVSSPLVLVYDALVRSYGGLVYESVVIVSSAIGILRYHPKKNEGSVSETKEQA